MSELVAAGAVLWRPGADGGVEVALVHRPRYDDWSLPKGKPDGDEALAATAVREVCEETGHGAVLGRRLPAVRYRVPAGPKVAHYWAARSTGGEFLAGDEVDELRWVAPSAAPALLTYPHDREVVDALPPSVAAERTVLLVRHAKAGKKEQWHGDDDERPLSGAGREQAAALRALLPLFGASRVHAAPRVRCRQTVQAVADDLGVPVHDEPLLSEEGYWVEPAAGFARLRSLAAGAAEPVVVCSQGGVIPDVVAAIARRSGLPLDDDVPSRKGSLWVLTFRPASGPDDPGGSGGSGGSGGPDGPALVAADYYPDPFR